MQNKFCIDWGQVTMYTKAGVSEHGSAWDKISLFFGADISHDQQDRQASCSQTAGVEPACPMTMLP